MFTEKTLPIIIALFVLFVTILTLTNANTEGYYVLVGNTDSSATGSENTLEQISINFPMVAGLIIVLVALVSVVAYFARQPKAKKGSRKSRRKAK